MTKQEILQSKDNGSTYIDEDVIDGDINVVYEAMDEWAEIKAKEIAIDFLIECTGDMFDRKTANRLFNEFYL